MLALRSTSPTRGGGGGSVLRKGNICDAVTATADTRAGLSVRYVGQIERREASSTVTVLERLADACGVEVTELLRPVPKSKSGI
jgi:hypothetical protein